MSDTPLPKLPSAPRTAKRKPAYLGTIIAMFGVLVIGGFMIGLTAMVMPNVLGLVIVVFVAAVFFMLHYLTWGRWLINRRARMQDESRLDR